MLIDTAKEYTSYGLSVIPTKADKRPIGAWKISQTERVVPTDRFVSYREKDEIIETKHMAIVGGKVSGNLECIDVDLKYDLTGTLKTAYMKAIQAIDPSLLKKLVVEETPSKGYHFIYRVDESVTLEGNRKLAQRPATEKEKEADPKVKVMVLLETRGEGGYFLCAPSDDYRLIQHDFAHLPILSAPERNVLLDCALSFNLYFEEPVSLPTKNIPVGEDGISPFEDYNARANVVDFLVSEGWKLINESSSNWNLLRPGSTTSVTSAGVKKENNIFHCFSTSTPFDPAKGYNPAQVYSILKHGGDYSAAARQLIKEGYGKRATNGTATIPIKQAPKQVISATDEDFSFLVPQEEVDDYIQRNVDGTFEMGVFCGIPSLDKYYKFKKAHFNIFLGLDNVGKSTVVWYLLLLSARIHGWRWIVYSAENSAGFFTRRMYEFYWGKEVKHMTPFEVAEAKKFINEHFTIINNEESYTYRDILNAGDKLCKKGKKENKPYMGLLCDPYNSLDLDREDLKALGGHEYHYNASTKIRQFCKRNNCCFYAPSHPVTEAMRRMHPKGAKLRISDDNIIDIEGYPMPPHKADVEGGGKFANRCNDFVIVHRYTQHPDIWDLLELHVQKVKEQETGGKQTVRDNPVRIVMTRDKCGFEDNGTNPMTGKFVEKILPKTPEQITSSILKRPIAKNIVHFQESAERDVDDRQAELNSLADELDKI